MEGITANWSQVPEQDQRPAKHYDNIEAMTKLLKYLRSNKCEKGFPDFQDPEVYAKFYLIAQDYA